MSRPIIEVPYRNVKSSRMQVEEVRMRMMAQSVERLWSYTVTANRRKRAQYPTVATEHIRRATRCTNVFSMVEHWINLTLNLSHQHEFKPMQMHASEAPHVKLTNPTPRYNSLTPCSGDPIAIVLWSKDIHIISQDVCFKFGQHTTT
jgi:hypothetical protein